MKNNNDWEKRFWKADIGCCNAGECFGDHNADIKQFIQEELDRQREELLEEITHWMRVEHDITIVYKKDWDKFISKLKSKGGETINEKE